MYVYQTSGYFSRFTGSAYSNQELLRIPQLFTGNTGCISSVIMDPACPCSVSCLAFRHFSPSHLIHEWPPESQKILGIRRFTLILSMAGGLEQDDFSDPFQPKSFYDFMILLPFAKHQTLGHGCRQKRWFEPTKFTFTISKFFSSKVRLPLQFQSSLEYQTSIVLSCSIPKKAFFKKSDGCSCLKSLTF